MKQLALIFTLLAAAITLQAQSYKFAFGLTGKAAKGFTVVKQTDTYTDERGYGYDFSTAPDGKTQKAWFFSVRVPDGNYRVTLTLGSKRQAGVTTVRAESRRLFFERVSTKKGELRRVACVVNKRDTIIRPRYMVKIKPGERTYPDWDNRLTLEFCGPQPQVAAVEIERDDSVPTIFLCGNSTVVDQPYDPYTSWGQMFTRFVGPQAAVANYAESGLSADSFLYQRRLEKILTQIKQGDYVFMEFGHNDQKQKGPGKGAYYSFAYSIKQYIDEARAKGATPVIVTPTRRRAWDKNNKTIVNTHADYPAALMDIAKREGVAVIDLQSMTKTLYEHFGYEGSKCLLVHYPANTFKGQRKALADNTHHNAFGAYEVAKCVCQGIRDAALPLTTLLRPDFQGFSPAEPDAPEKQPFEPSQFVRVQKPDGN